MGPPVIIVCCSVYFVYSKQALSLPASRVVVYGCICKNDEPSSTVFIIICICYFVNCYFAIFICFNTLFILVFIKHFAYSAQLWIHIILIIMVLRF